MLSHSGSVMRPHVIHDRTNSLNRGWCRRCKTTGGLNRDLLVDWPGRRYKAFKTGTVPDKTGRMVCLLRNRADIKEWCSCVTVWAFCRRVDNGHVYFKDVQLKWKCSCCKLLHEDNDFQLSFDTGNRPTWPIRMLPTKQIFEEID